MNPQRQATIIRPVMMIRLAAPAAVSHSLNPSRIAGSGSETRATDVPSDFVVYGSDPRVFFFLRRTIKRSRQISPFQPQLRENGIEIMIRAATWNMAGAAPEYLGVGLEGITQKIIKDGFDFCSLQEVNQDARPVQNNPLSSANFPRYMEAELIKAGRIGDNGRALGEAFFTAANIEDAKMEGWPPRTYGNCILSTRHLFRHKLSFQLDGPDVPPNTPEWGKDIRILQLAQVRSEGPQLWVANTHLSATPNDTVVDYQARNIVTLINKFVPEDASVILNGDFNKMLDGFPLDSLCEAFDCHTRDADPTFPLNRADPNVVPNRGIDHIFTRHMKVNTVSVECLRELSDHAVVIADMEPVRPRRIFDIA